MEQNEKVVTTEEVKKGPSLSKIELGEGSIERVEGGLKVKFKSEKICSYFKVLSKETTGTMYISDNTFNFFKVNPDFLGFSLNGNGDYPLVSFNCNDTTIFNGRDRVNLFFFRGVQVKEGIEIVIPGVFTVEQVGTLNKAMSKAMEHLYKNFIRTVKTSCKVTVLEVSEG